MVQQLARGFDLGRHLGQAELQRLVLEDRLAEGDALLRVAQRGFAVERQHDAGDRDDGGFDRGQVLDAVDVRRALEAEHALAELHAERDFGQRAVAAADVRDVIVEGQSGILAISPPHERPTWEPSRRRLTWPNGAIATTYSAEEPDQLRGPQCDSAWCDELAAWRYPEAWDQLQMGLRLGDDPRVVVTTTPRPTELVRALAASPTTRVTRGRTLDNARNLAPGVVEALTARYGNTRLGRQELDGEILDDAPGALWRLAMFDASRVDTAPTMRRVVVAIDPAVTAHEGSDETGIVVAGLGLDGRAYVIEDLSGVFPAEQWARRAVEAYRRHRADRIVAEVNQGGDLVASVLRAELARGSWKREFVAIGALAGTLAAIGASALGMVLATQVCAPSVTIACSAGIRLLAITSGLPPSMLISRCVMPLLAISAIFLSGNLKLK